MYGDEMTVFINTCGMLDSYPLTTLEEDPKWFQFQIVTIGKGEYVVVNKSKGRRGIEYEVCSEGVLFLHINRAGMEAFYAMYPEKKDGPKSISTKKPME